MINFLFLFPYSFKALICIGVVGEGSIKYLEPRLAETVKNVVYVYLFILFIIYYLLFIIYLFIHYSLFLRDSHPRVRWAACNTVGQLSSDFGPGV
jgi:hypothetical protein